ncbi:MAG: hypothetical protein CMK89_06560 [Pseudomonadales bacterium]|nr:hypothetical protein [Pseudomonadales bacterium]
MKATLRAANHTGFTLVELVITISLMGVVSVLVSTMVGNQMLGYVDTARRSDLVARADMALQMIARDVRSAVPYSVRVSGAALEWVPVLEWGRYRKRPDAGAADPVLAEAAVLDFSNPDTLFEVLHTGTMPSLPSNPRLVVGNSPAMGLDGLNVYGGLSSGGIVPIGTHVITPTGITLGSSGNSISMNPGFQFALGSAAGRFYLVNHAASYICSGGSITRYGNYNIQNAQPASAPPSSTSVLLIDGVTSCQFGYTAIDATYGMLTITLQVTESGESVTLSRVITIENRS